MLFRGQARQFPSDDKLRRKLIESRGILAVDFRSRISAARLPDDPLIGRELETREILAVDFRRRISAISPKW